MSFERYAQLDDLATRTDGGGRYIDAYAAVFNAPQEIRDREGHYMETIAPTAFDRTIAQKGTGFQVLFNHGKTIHGTPSERYSMPYGVPAEVVSDGRGLRTSTRMADTPLADEVYTLARDGALTGMSFSGVWRDTAAGQKIGSLAHKVRTEIQMSEFGITPFPAYTAAQIVQVRATLREFDAATLADIIDLDDSEMIAALRAVLDGLPADTGTQTDPKKDEGHADTGSVNINAIAARTLLQRIPQIPRRGNVEA